MTVFGPTEGKSRLLEHRLLLLDRERSEKLHIESPNQEHAVNNAYELPLTEKVIRCIHAVAGYPIKATLFKAIQAGNFDTWPMVTVKNVNKFFPEFVETQKCHMGWTKKGVRSTKVSEAIANTLLMAFEGRKKDEYKDVHRCQEDNIF